MTWPRCAPDRRLAVQPMRCSRAQRCVGQALETATSQNDAQERRPDARQTSCAPTRMFAAVLLDCAIRRSSAPGTTPNVPTTNYSRTELCAVQSLVPVTHLLNCALAHRPRALRTSCSRAERCAAAALVCAIRKRSAAGHLDYAQPTGCCRTLLCVALQRVHVTLLGTAQAALLHAQRWRSSRTVRSAGAALRCAIRRRCAMERTGHVQLTSTRHARGPGIQSSRRPTSRGNYPTAPTAPLFQTARWRP